MKIKMKRIISMAACMSIIATNVVAAPTIALTYDQISDMPDWWSQTAVEQAVDNDILEVNNFLIRPLETLTRVEMAHGVNSVFGGYEKADLSEYTDVSRYASYYEDLQKAVALGAFSGYGDGTLRPEANITREEMFTVIYKTLNMEAGDKALLNKFKDKDMVSDWAEDATTSMLANNYIAGNANGTINPKGNITREEFAQIISNIIDRYYTEPKTYANENCETAIINTKGVTLKDSTITGDLIIGDGVGDGEVVLDNVKVEGRTIVRGGGENSIKFLNGSELKGKVVVNNRYSTIRLYNSNSTVNKIAIETDAILEGDFNEVSINKAVKVETKGNTEHVIAREKAEITVSKGQIEKIELLENSANTTIKGNGKVTTVEAKVNNVKVEVIGAKVIAGNNVTGITAGGKKVEAGESVIVEEKKSSGGGGGGGGSSSSTTVKIPELKLTDIEDGGKIDLGKNYAKFEVAYVDSYSDYGSIWYSVSSRVLEPGKLNGSGWCSTTKEVKVKYNNTVKSVRIRPDVPELEIDKLNGVVNIAKNEVDKYEFCNIGGQDEYSKNSIIGKYFPEEKEGKIKITTYTNDSKKLAIRLKATDMLLESAPFRVDMYNGKIIEISDISTDVTSTRQHRTIRIDDQDRGGTREFSIISKNPEDVYVVSEDYGKTLENMDLAVNDFVTIYKTQDDIGSSYVYIDNIALIERNIPNFTVVEGVLDFGADYSKYELSEPGIWWYTSASKLTAQTIDFNNENPFLGEVSILNNGRVVQNVTLRIPEDIPEEVKIDYENRQFGVDNKENYEYVICDEYEVLDAKWSNFNTETINVSDEATIVHVRKKTGSLGNGVATYPITFTFNRKLTAIEIEALEDLQKLNMALVERENPNKLYADSNVPMYKVAMTLCELYGMDLEDDEMFPVVDRKDENKRYIAAAIKEGLMPRSEENGSSYRSVSFDEACEYFVNLVGKEDVSNYVAEAENIGITKNVTELDNRYLSIGQLIVMAHNVLDVGTWDDDGNKLPSLRDLIFTVSIPELVLTDIEDGGRIDLGTHWDKFEIAYVDSYTDQLSPWYSATSRILEEGTEGSEGWFARTKEIKVKYEEKEKSVRIRPDAPELEVDKINGMVIIPKEEIDKYEIYDGKYSRPIGEYYPNEKEGKIRIVTYAHGNNQLRIRLKATDTLLESVAFNLDMHSGKLLSVSPLLTDSNSSQQYRLLEVDDQDSELRYNFKVTSKNPEDTYIVKDGIGKNLEELDFAVNDVITVYTTYDEFAGWKYIDNIMLVDRNIPTFRVSDGILDLGDEYSKYALSEPHVWWYMNVNQPTTSKVDLNTWNYTEDVVILLNNDRVVQNIKIRDEKDAPRDEVKIDYEARTLSILNEEEYQYFMRDNYLNIDDVTWNEFVSETINVPDERTVVYVRKKVGSLNNGVASLPSSFMFNRKLTEVEKEALKDLSTLEFMLVDRLGVENFSADTNVSMYEIAMLLCELSGMDMSDESLFPIVDRKDTNKRYVMAAVNVGLMPEVVLEESSSKLVTMDLACEYFVNLVGKKNISDYVAEAKNLGITKNITEQSDKYLSMGQLIVMAHNALDVGTWDEDGNKLPSLRDLIFAVSIPELVLIDISKGGKINLGENWDKVRVSYVDSYSDFASPWYSASNRILEEGVVGGSGWYSNTKIVKVKYDGVEKSIRIRPDVPSFEIDKINGILNIPKDEINKYEFYNNNKTGVIGKDLNEREGKIKIVTYTHGKNKLGIRLKATDMLLESVAFELDMYSGKIVEISDVLTDERSSYQYRTLKINDQDSGVIRSFRIISKNPEDTYVVKNGIGKNLKDMDFAVNDLITIYKTYDEYVGSSYSSQNVYIDNIVLNAKDIPNFVVTDGMLDLGTGYSKYELRDASSWWYSSVNFVPTNQVTDINEAIDEEIMNLAIMNNNEFVQKLQIRAQADCTYCSIDYENRRLTVSTSDKYEYKIDSGAWTDLLGTTLKVPDNECTISIRKKESSLNNGVKPRSSKYSFEEKIVEGVYEIYSADVKTGTRAVLYDKSQFSITIDASSELKYVRLDLLYSPNDDFASNGKWINGKTVKEVGNGKLTFSFEECFGNSNVELENYKLAVVLTLSTSSEFDKNIVSKTFHGYCYIPNDATLPEFTLNEDEMSLDLGEDWEKYQVAYVIEEPVMWYAPLVHGSVSGIQMPIREDNKVYLLDIPYYEQLARCNYMYISYVGNSDLGYKSVNIPKYEVEVIADKIKVSGAGTHLPTKEVVIKLEPNEGYKYKAVKDTQNIYFPELVEEEHITGYTTLSFKMPKKDVRIELDIQKVDDISGLDGEEKIRDVIQLDIIKGYEDGSFRPENTMTRAEMAVVLCKMIGITASSAEISKNVASKFSDVEPGKWYTGWINLAEASELFDGLEVSDKFNPNQLLTCDDLLTICVNALGKSVSSEGANSVNYLAEATRLGLLDGIEENWEANRGNIARVVWNTLNCPHVCVVNSETLDGVANWVDTEKTLLEIYLNEAELSKEEKIGDIIQLNIIEGYDDGSFRPENTMTRAEMAVVLCKMIGLTEFDANANQNMDSRFNDVKAGEWYTGWINLAESRGLFEGLQFSDTFSPNEVLTNTDLLTVCVNALGKGKIVSSTGTYPTNYIVEATRLGLLKDANKSSTANRQNIAVVVWNTLNCPHVCEVQSETLEGAVAWVDTGKTLLEINLLDKEWQFAKVDYIYDAEQDGENEDVYEQKLRLIMMDGRKVRTFKLIYDVNEAYESSGVIANPNNAVDGVALVDVVTEDTLIAFKANDDYEISLNNVVAVDPSAPGNTTIDGYKFYIVDPTDTGVIDFDTKRFEINGTRYKVTSDTTIVDLEEEIPIEWEDLVDENEELVGVDTLLIVEEGEVEITHIVALTSPSRVNSIKFALVLDAEYTVSSTKTGAKLLGVDGQEYVYEYDADTVLEEGTLISYTVSGDKLIIADVNIDLAAATVADEKAEVNSIDKGAYLVESVDSDYFTYTDEENAGFTPMTNRIIDVNMDKVIVVKYELNDEGGTFVEAEFNEETIEGAYMLAFDMDSDVTDAELLVIFAYFDSVES